MKSLFNIKGSPCSTNVKCPDVIGRDSWDWVGARVPMEKIIPPRVGGGNMSSNTNLAPEDWLIPVDLFLNVHIT